MNMYEVSVRNLVQRSRTDRSQSDRSLICPFCRLDCKNEYKQYDHKKSYQINLYNNRVIRDNHRHMFMRKTCIVLYNPLWEI